MLKKRLKLQESNDNISMNSTSSATIAGSLASALSVGMVTVADPKTSSSELRYVGSVFIIYNLSLSEHFSLKIVFLRNLKK